MNEFTQLYNKHHAQIYKYLYYVTGDRHVAEELTQEAFFQAFRSLHRFRGGSKVSTWLFQIAKFIFYAYIRERQKQDVIVAELPIVATPERVWERKEAAQFVVQAIQRLATPYKEVIVLRVYNELSFNEIGAIFNSTAVWARVTFYRAKQQLAALLQEMGVEWHD